MCLWWRKTKMSGEMTANMKEHKVSMGHHNHFYCQTDSLKRHWPISLIIFTFQTLCQHMLDKMVFSSNCFFISLNDQFTSDVTVHVYVWYVPPERCASKSEHRQCVSTIAPKAMWADTDLDNIPGGLEIKPEIMCHKWDILCTCLCVRHVRFQHILTFGFGCV